jgi:hypothetical protein
MAYHLRFKINNDQFEESFDLVGLAAKRANELVEYGKGLIGASIVVEKIIFIETPKVMLW